MGAMNPFLEQNYARTRDDTTGADPGTPNWITTENQSTRETVDVSGGDADLRIRFVVSNTGSANATNQFNVHYSKNSGAYTSVTTSSSNVQKSSTASSSGDQTTLNTGNFQLSAGTGTAVNGAYDDGGTDNGWGNNLANGNYFELEVGLAFISADLADSDTLDFQLKSAGADFDQYDTNATPGFTIQKGGATHAGSGTCASTFTLGADATRTTPGAGQADSTFTLAADATIKKPAAGQADSTFTLAADATIKKEASGQADSAYTLAADATIIKGASGQADAVVSLAGDADLTIRVSGQADAVFTLTGFATVPGGAGPIGGGLAIGHYM